jgi:hypothetical protein
MVAVPMTPAAPVTTATLPSRRIRSGISGISPGLVRLFRISGGSAEAARTLSGRDYFIRRAG